MAQLHGPNSPIPVRLALDTGATSTVVNHAPLVYAGYDPAASTERTEATMGGGVEYSAVVVVDLIEALGETRESMSFLAHTLPPSASIEGVLGLDFFRNRRPLIDFTTGEIELT